MDLPTYFADFLTNIKRTPEQQADSRESHRRLRDAVLKDRDLDKYVITTLLQGSYRRSTDIKPFGDEKSDVDILVITNMDKRQFPDGASALEEFRPFLDDNYPANYEPHGHSWAVTDGEIKLDLVPTSAPSEAVQQEFGRLRESDDVIEPGLESFRAIRKTLLGVREALAKGDDWKREPLEIPDRERRVWERTHPLAQIEWTEAKNGRCNGHFINVVRVVKWWWLQFGKAQDPGGYLVEAIVAQCCPDQIAGVAEGFARSLDAIVAAFRSDHAAKRTPVIPDHGLPTNNVLARLRPADFSSFYEAAEATTRDANTALASSDRRESVRLWRQIFGEDFPSDGTDGGDNGGQKRPPYPPPSAPAVGIGKERFA